MNRIFFPMRIREMAIPLFNTPISAVSNIFGGIMVTRLPGDSSSTYTPMPRVAQFYDKIIPK